MKMLRAKRQLANGGRRPKEPEKLIKYILNPETVRVGHVRDTGVAWFS